MAMQVWSLTRAYLSDTGEPGELVCAQPFPRQSVQFWGPNGAEKYKGAYFEKFAGMWAHGTFVRVNRHTVGLVMLGRPDGVLNPKGVRFGGTEIYGLLLRRVAVRIEDSLYLGRRQRGDADETVVLFLKKREGSPFSAGLEEDLSPRHVPDAISECPEIPVPANGKKVEVLVKKILWAGSCIGKPLALSQFMLTFARLSWLFDFIKADAGLGESDWREWDEAAEQRKERQVQEYGFEDHATGTKRGPVLCFRPRERASTSH
ncbi:hypothetical protein BDW75DRAFT_245747 [Aspergillus navahoensis]